jgi:hypothetical protein
LDFGILQDITRVATKKTFLFVRGFNDDDDDKGMEEMGDQKWKNSSFSKADSLLCGRPRASRAMAATAAGAVFVRGHLMKGLNLMLSLVEPQSN